MFSNGSTIVKVDFHMHTIADKEFSFTGDKDYFVSEYIQKLVDEDIVIGVITNHNKFAKDEYDQLRKTARKKGILILPGIELSIKEGANGVHTLIVFNPDEWIVNGTNRIEAFLNEVFKDTPNRENENTRCKYDLPGVIDILDKYNADYFIVFAHVEADKGFIKECGGGLIKSLASNPWFKKRILGLQKVRTRNKIPVFEKQIGYKLPFLEGSDCKNIDAIGKEKGFSLIKIGDLSYNALKFALQAHLERVYANNITHQYSYIKGISIEGGLLDKQNIGLSPELNTFIGIRGSGKSALIELLRYALELPSSVDEDYKDELVNYVLGSGGMICLNVVDEHGTTYQIKRILGEKPYVYDANGNNLGIDVTSVIRNPVYFGQKDLALTKAGYEFELLHKLVKNDDNADIRLLQCEGELKRKIEEWYSLEEIPGQIEDLNSRLRELKHKVKVFKERGVVEKLEKQTAYTADFTEAKSITANCKSLINKLKGAIDYYDERPIMSDGYSSEYNKEIFASIIETVNSIQNHFRLIRNETVAIESDIDKLEELQNDLKKAIDELKEEFAEIRRELSGAQLDLDIDAYTKYQGEMDSTKREIAAKEIKLGHIEPLQKEIMGLIARRTEILRDNYIRYKSEIEKVNATQHELQLSIEFKGDKKAFVEQLREQFSGTNLNGNKYQEIASAFPDIVAIIEDVTLLKGEKLKPMLTEKQFLAVEERINENYKKYISLKTADLVEIKYHGKALSRHSTGQRASALALFILAQNDNDVIIIDQPEDDLDNQVIYSEFIKRIKEKKVSTQFIFATHNANIPVLGDAEKIVAASYTNLKMGLIQGTIDTPESHKQIVTIMEGGQEAFNRRNEIYNSWA